MEQNNIQYKVSLTEKPKQTSQDDQKNRHKMRSLAQNPEPDGQQTKTMNNSTHAKELPHLKNTLLTTTMIPFNLN